MLIRRRAALVAFAGFVALGLPEAVLGTAWPDMADDRTRSLGDLQWLLVLYTIGYLVASAPAGALTVRIGVRWTAASGVTCSAAGLAAFALGPGWLPLLAASGVLGVGAGLLDTALNVWATSRGPRVMNLLHACFGVGTTVGPPLTIVMAHVADWRAAYLVLLLVDGVVLALIVTVGPDAPAPGAARVESRGPRRRSPAAPLILSTFAVYVAVEVTAGAWGYSLLREHHGAGAGAAGAVMAGYWGGLTGGRLLLGVAGARVAPLAVLRVGATGAVGATAVLSLTDSTAAAAVALVLLGVALSGMFPALMGLTPLLVGSEQAPVVVGWSLSASGVAGGLAAIVIGQQVDRVGIDAVPPNLAAASLLLAALVAFVPAQRTPDQASSSTLSGPASSVGSSSKASTDRSPAS